MKLNWHPSSDQLPPPTESEQPITLSELEDKLMRIIMNDSRQQKECDEKIERLYHIARKK